MDKAKPKRNVRRTFELVNKKPLLSNPRNPPVEIQRTPADFTLQAKLKRPLQNLKPADFTLQAKLKRPLQNLKPADFTLQAILKRPPQKLVVKNQKKVVRGEQPKPIPVRFKLCHQLRLAVHEGGSTDPKQNLKLRRAIRRALEGKMSVEGIGRVLLKCELPEINVNTYLLQMRYQRKVYIICAVHTHNLPDLQGCLMALLRKFGAKYAYAMHLFNNSALIEAMLPYQTVVDFTDLEGHITADARACKAKEVQIMDYETGGVQFKCDPIYLTNVCKAIDNRGYRILHTEYAFTPKKPIELNWYEHEGYEKFLRRLQRVPEVESIYDNIKVMLEGT